MPRIVKKPGDILRFPLTAGGMYGYAQWLPDGTARVFRAATAGDLIVAQVTTMPVAFRVLVFNDTPNRYGWSKIGRAEIPADCARPQRYAKKDVLSGELSVYVNGVQSPAEAADLVGLETLAVWAHPHIVERLEALLEGRESVFAKSVAVISGGDAGGK